MADEPNPEADTLSPPEAFALVGDEVRTAVLRILLERYEHQPLSFSELYEAADVDDSGRFNYHLQRLVGHFLERTDEGYRLRDPGRKLAHAILAGTYTDSPSISRTDAPGTCYACGETALVASYGDERFAIECAACGEDVLTVSFPPAGVTSRPPEAAIEAFDRWSTRQAALVADGICPACAGAMDASVTFEPPDSLAVDVLPKFRCRVCSYVGHVSFGSVAIHREDVLSVLHRHGWERDRVYWSIEHCVTDAHTTVESTDPVRISEAFPLEEATVSVTFDEDVGVVDVAERPEE
ncbi:DUF7351 domain-containing protein [Natronobeatus ordinarius]|uniref:DUF7351 domain-containing protein n=1 Tax=Natronobeatus ordinarius TaxID=2963433 RepID=UPI0020CDC25B|nr:hypothetical protein [Natronobeatus ordinarius]